MNVNKMAKRDAADWLAAEMFYGKGAGVRRRLLEAQIASKVERVSGYAEAFNKAYERLDMNKFAKAAIKERKRLDRSNAVGKNIRAIARGDARGLSTVVIVVGGAAWLAHETGYDLVALEEARKLKRKAKAKYAMYKLSRPTH